MQARVIYNPVGTDSEKVIFQDSAESAFMIDQKKYSDNSGTIPSEKKPALSIANDENPQYNLLNSPKVGSAEDVRTESQEGKTRDTEFSVLKKWLNLKINQFF